MANDWPSDPHSLPNEGLVPIRTVSSLTGVNPVTLRAWERRYGLIKPVRTPKGHRLYTMADVDYIQQVTVLLQAGMSIGQVRHVLDPEQPRTETAEEQKDGKDGDVWFGYQQGMIKAVEGFEESDLDDLYNEALSLYPVNVVIDRLVVPLLQELGRRWEQTEGSIAEEHFFGVYLRNKLGARFHHMRRSPGGPKLLAACLPGEQHEIGLLLFALAAMDRDYRVILLGANMPLAVLPPVVRRTASQAIVLSGSASCSIEDLRGDLLHLVGEVAIPVFAGGKVAVTHAEDLTATGIGLLGDNLTVAIGRLDMMLNR
jgi:DNA-binding transcriptional MerR regulator